MNQTRISAATTGIALGVNLPSTAAVADSFSVTAQVFDSLGNSHDLDITFTKTAANTWSWAASDPTLDGGATSSGTAVGSGDIVFDTDGTPLTLTVLGMGKLGGGELNFSSDIDLVFLFAEHGETDGRRPLTHEEYFNRLGRRVAQLLGTVTHQGFVYRVDLRLRPFGESGPLVVSFGALEDYLQQHGRDWERYAYVKARPISGATRFEELYRNVLRPFVYRRYLDYGVFESLRGMKELIARVL